MTIRAKSISAVMTRTVSRVGIEQPAGEALATMHEKAVSSVLIVENELILGIITERDIVRALHAASNLKSLSCADLMQAPVLSVQESTSCLDAYHQMAARGVRHLAVTDAGGHVVGIASEGDVMRNFGIEYYLNFKDVAGVMSTEFCQLPKSATVGEAVGRMLDEHQSCVVVVDARGHPGGVLTERDVVRLCNEQLHPERLTLEQAMHVPVITVKRHKRLHAAVRVMEDAHIRRLVVVDADGVACGLLTHHEIARGLEGDYASYLKNVVELQAHHLQQAAQAVDEKLLLANILRSVVGTAVLASDLEYRISYATASCGGVLGLGSGDIGGADLRATLKLLGWEEAGVALDLAAAARCPRHYKVATGRGNVDFQVSLLLDVKERPQGYLVMAQKG